MRHLERRHSKDRETIPSRTFNSLTSSFKSLIPASLDTPVDASNDVNEMQ